LSDSTTPKSPEREAAEIAKLQAETNELLLQQELRKVEIRHQLAEAVGEEHRAAVAAISRAERERTEELTKVQDHYVYHHFFDGVVGEKNVYLALNTLNAWHRTAPDSNWDITINSPGGSVIDGMHLFDAITAYSKRGGGNHHITMTVRGYAASMAGILLQSADTRLIGPESYLMVHEVSSWAQGKINEIKDEVKFLDKISERVTNLFVDRSEGKITKDEFTRLWERKDWWLDSKEALERGFVDNIG
jgi:ATP-dependent protease ClpP protease subunit